ncbi:MAG: class II fumarate hydratase [Actinomycetota bacterium]
MPEQRIERDSMGEVSVPASAYYGAQTQRAADNFPLSGWRFGRRFIAALGMLKWAAALANEELGLLEPRLSLAIRAAAEEVIAGRHDDQFIIDVFQTGSGTSTNMNANEVIANRANELLGGERGSKWPVHPNDHVNTCQSSNDVIPTVTHLAALSAIHEVLLVNLARLRQALEVKAGQFDGILKSGRTHLMDATPVRLGQEFAGYASQVAHAVVRLDNATAHLHEVALGGTAVGTGINAHADFAGRALAALRSRTGYPLVEAANHFEAQGARDAVVEVSGALKSVAVSLARIANDLRWLASGPRTGIAEIRLPELQPGSSIMPGKVNPVIPEAVIQVAAQVIGNDAAITLCGLGSIFELNTMMPLMAHDVQCSIEILGAAAGILASKCVEGIEANPDRAGELLERSLVIVTALVPLIGYDAAAEVSKEAFATGQSLREIVLARGLLTSSEVDWALDLRRMTEPGLGPPGSASG